VMMDVGRSLSIPFRIPDYSADGSGGFRVFGPFNSFPDSRELISASTSANISAFNSFPDSR